MDPENNKTLLVFLFWCIILFNHAQAIRVMCNQNDSRLPFSYSSTSKLQSPPSLVSTPISQQPLSPSPPNIASTLIPHAPPKSHPSLSPPLSISASSLVPHTKPRETPSSTIELLSLKPKLSTTQISLQTISLNVEVGIKTISDPQIKSLCDKTDHPDLCLASIEPFFNGKSDLPSVIEMLIKDATKETKQAIATATKMATDPKSDPTTRARLEHCKKYYNYALNSLKKAMDALPLKDVGTITSMVSGANTEYESCDDGFIGEPDPIPGGVSPMAKINEKLINIGAFILIFTKMLP